MAKFHVSEDGVARRCVAKIIPCKLNHFNSQEEAQKSYERNMANNTFSPVKNNIVKNSRIRSLLNRTSLKTLTASVEDVKNNAENSLKAFADGGYIPQTVTLNNLSKKSENVRADVSGIDDKAIMKFIEEKDKKDKAKKNNNSKNTQQSSKKLSLTKKAVYAATSLALVSGLAACGNENEFEPTQNLDDSISVSDALNNADEIRLKKDAISWGDHWTVYADGTKVADINGEALYAFGDTYTMRSNEGNVVGFETEDFLIADRGSQTYDANGEHRGHIDQNVISIGYSFDIYEGEEQVGSARQNLSLNLTAEVKDMDDNVEYKIDRALVSFGSDMTVTMVDNNEEQDVDAMDAVWNAVIMSEIHDAAAAENNSNT